MALRCRLGPRLRRRARLWSRRRPLAARAAPRRLLKLQQWRRRVEVAGLGCVPLLGTALTHARRLWRLRRAAVGLATCMAPEARGRYRLGTRAAQDRWRPCRARGRLGCTSYQGAGVGSGRERWQRMAKQRARAALRRIRRMQQRQRLRQCRWPLLAAPIASPALAGPGRAPASPTAQVPGMLARARAGASAASHCRLLVAGGRRDRGSRSNRSRRRSRNKSSRVLKWMYLGEAQRRRRRRVGPGRGAVRRCPPPPRRAGHPTGSSRRSEGARCSHTRSPCPG